MSKNQFSEQELREKLAKLEKLSKKILESNGYTKEANKILLLQELIKEQLRNESTHYTTSKAR